MNNLITSVKRTTLTRAAIVAALMIIASSAHSAGYIKFDGVEGESKSKPVPQRVDSNHKPKPAALLLPAVQKVREAATTTKRPTKNNDATAGDEHEVTYDIAAGV